MSVTPLATDHAPRRIFVLDTNVLLYDPGALYVFDEHEVVVPMTVIEEVDRFKKDLNETGRNARTVSRYLDGMRVRGSLATGIEIEGGGLIKVDFALDPGRIPASWGSDSNDNRILQTVATLADHFPDRRVTLVTRDTNMRLKCDALGIAAEDYQHSRIDVDEQYTGVHEMSVPAAFIEDLYQNGTQPVDPSELFHPQQFVVLTADDGSNKSAMVRVDSRKQRFKLVGRHKEGSWGIFARNKEQLFAMELLLDNSVQLVTLNGVAGTGKTLLALACGLKLTADDAAYRRMLVSRPIFPLGRDIGFLPGDIEQKLNPWMKPIFDNLELIVQTTRDVGRGTRNPEPQFQYLIDQKIIVVEPLTYIRGRSIPKQFLIIDEAQNLTPHEVKTVLTRAGEDTKIVMTGDPYQIDNPYVDALSNGLTYVIERFKDTHLAGHVTLRKGERSPLAELATRVL